MENRSLAPMFIPLETTEFWTQLRLLIREELVGMKKTEAAHSLMQTPGLTEKPLFRIQEVCKIFQVSRQTIYDWVKHDKLKPLKVRSRVYFLAKDIQDLLNKG